VSTVVPHSALYSSGDGDVPR